MTKRICKIDGCEREYEAKGLCKLHNERRRAGRDLQTPIQYNVPNDMPLVERLTYRIVGECWEFDRTRDSLGYGVLGYRGEPKKSHRAAYEVWVGPIPEGLCVCHRCDNPPCINPAHLFLGTRADNNKDRTAKGRAARGMRNSQCKLTESEVRAIRSDPRSHRAIAASGDVGRNAVANIKSGKTWGWLD